jgi:hypothetical protein
MQIDSKYLKKLYDFNQDAKIFGDRYIMYNGHILCDPSDMSRLAFGHHMGKYDIELYNGSDEYAHIVMARNFYRLMKLVKKKDFKELAIDNDCIKFILDESIDVNKLVVLEQKTPIAVHNTLATIGFGIDVNVDEFKIDEFDRWILSSDDVEALVKNEYLMVGKGWYQTKITKELIPGLKKTHKVEIIFGHNHTSDELYSIYFDVERATINTIHKYNAYIMR